ncbi:C39 family peptidase [Pontibacillus sp. HMF3514]|uniref:C39 family peptidase n=1 Tax=Pontibacillus sp. HMF3514 TaxID=2692425 RepID=UPI00131FC3C7|nr:C39 family peptidase [Pontibacillus sp. HMF3514]QHE54151.1 peptidase C39 family protein [Pontibacillus sp. HMF3514]
MKLLRTITVIFLFLLTIFIPTRKVRAKKRISAPFIRQMPELPRGCEVTSLAMLLQHAGVNVDKMKLASEVKKVPFYMGDGFRGNPYEGFVGDMYDFNIPGFGVYHGPIYELANKYIPNRVLDLTGKGQKHLYSMLDRGIPVWVITNSLFEPLSEEQFQSWKTKQGEFPLTFEEHSVLITGYDRNDFYIHDPLYSKPHRKIDQEKFIASWKQMGQQAISYVPEGEKAK